MRIDDGNGLTRSSDSPARNPARGSAPVKLVYTGNADDAVMCRWKRLGVSLGAVRLAHAGGFRRCPARFNVIGTSGAQYAKTARLVVFTNG